MTRDENMHHFHPNSRSASSEPTTHPWFWQFQPIKTVSTLIHIWNTFQLPTNHHLLTDQAESSLFRRFDPHWCVSSFCCFHLGESTDSEPNTLSQSRQECRNPCDMVSDPPMLAQQVTHTILLSLCLSVSLTHVQRHTNTWTQLFEEAHTIVILFARCPSFPMSTVDNLEKTQNRPLISPQLNKTKETK